MIYNTPLEDKELLEEAIIKIADILKEDKERIVFALEDYFLTDSKKTDTDLLILSLFK
jgi:hypothetical protein